ncbi:PssD/Cps14F family polysaccharide biosynthesis glycosyltransferase [Glutamicibacter creatinolyticus]|uniref:PssD/Cps14F family polysaccharide biosynthesis glycosyltransferase n=1 Tax=Glutamicibacter creatinolyticus TaxID=162496 RepID=UPI00321745CC
MGTLLFVGSSGGHLAQMLNMSAWWKEHKRSWVTFDTPDATSALVGEKVTWAHHPTTRNLGNAVRNLLLSVRVLRAERPAAVISTGAGVALPFFITARFMRIPTVYVEVYDRIDSRTLTGRLCRPLSSVFCVQWEEQLKYYPGATLIGPLL